MPLLHLITAITYASHLHATCSMPEPEQSPARVYLRAHGGRIMRGPQAREGVPEPQSYAGLASIRSGYLNDKNPMQIVQLLK